MKSLFDDLYPHLPVHPSQVYKGRKQPYKRQMEKIKRRRAHFKRLRGKR